MVFECSKVFLVPKVAFPQLQDLIGPRNFQNSSLLMNKSVKSIFSIIFSAIGISFSGCSNKVTVAQMDRYFLADYVMLPDRDKLSVKMFDHAFYSREGSRGGRGVGGGGCGCN